MRRPRRLEQALRSIGAQTYSQVEAIVVNDGGVPVDAIVAAYATETGRPITYLALSENRGLAAARNAAASRASGDLLALLDDDDRYRPDHLERLVAALHTDAGAVLAYDDVLIQVEEGTEDDLEPRVVATCRFGLAYDKAIFDADDYIVPSATVLRREAFEIAGGFDETIPICEDWDFLLRLRERGALCYVGGTIGVDYSFRVSAMDNLGSVFDDRRRAVLDLLSRRYGLGPLVPKTFLDVARDLGFALVPAAQFEGME
jgi:glycosyltransferase involved in cell wall biosynthesis